MHKNRRPALEKKGHEYHLSVELQYQQSRKMAINVPVYLNTESDRIRARWIGDWKKRLKSTCSKWKKRELERNSTRPRCAWLIIAW